MNQFLRNRNPFMVLNYNKKGHRELLEYSQDLEKEEKSLSDQNSLELLKYSAILDSQLDWEYLELLDQVVHEWVFLEILSNK